MPWRTMTAQLLSNYLIFFCLIEEDRGFLQCAASGLVWVAFVVQALLGFLDASAYVTFRLPKARTEDVLFAIK